MMDIETIVAMNKQQGRKAKKSGKEPTQFDEEDIQQAESGDLTPLKKIINLGNYIPKGWKRFNTNELKDQLDLSYDWKFLDNGGLFVDSSGFGSESEPALSVNQFLQTVSKLFKIRDDLGFAICSEGQFQLTIGVYEEDK
jgi:hypothetical protein